jgi:hypothetical protein
MEAGQGKMQRRHGWLVRLAAASFKRGLCRGDSLLQALFLGEIIGKNKVNMRVVRIGAKGFLHMGARRDAVAADQFDARHQEPGRGNGRAVLDRLAIGGERSIAVAGHVEGLGQVGVVGRAVSGRGKHTQMRRRIAGTLQPHQHPGDVVAHHQRARIGLERRLVGLEAFGQFTEVGEARG